MLYSLMCNLAAALSDSLAKASEQSVASVSKAATPREGSAASLNRVGSGLAGRDTPGALDGMGGVGGGSGSSSSAGRCLQPEEAFLVNLRGGVADTLSRLVAARVVTSARAVVDNAKVGLHHHHHHHSLLFLSCCLTHLSDGCHLMWHGCIAGSVCHGASIARVAHCMRHLRSL